mgnify:CR=1 FL=1|tara:strand:- start:1569 stop:1751 length:183 start_codon:yes stop_codon:yes gene_type:complete
MKLDIPSLIVAAVILIAAILNRVGVASDDMAYTAFIGVLLVGFAWSRRQVCRTACAGARA